MKRIVATLTAILLTLSGVVALEAPASASSTRLVDVFSLQGGSITTNLGEEINWDWYSCGDSDGYQMFFDSGSLPPGLTWDNGVDYNSYPTGALTGTPTEVGSWTLSGFNCYFAMGPRSDNVGGGYSTAGSITINVVTPASQTPAISMVSLENSTCDFEIQGSFPELPQAGSAKLTLTNGTSTGEYVLGNVPAGVTYTVDGSLTDNLMILNDVLSVTTEPTFQCGDSITATVSYNAVGKAIASASDSAVVDKPASPAPTLIVSNLDDNQCNVSIRAILPVAAAPGSAMLHLTNGTNNLDITLSDNPLNGEYHLTLSMFDIEGSIEASPNAVAFVSSEFPQLSRLYCEQTMDFSFSYNQAGHAKATASALNVLTSRDGAAPAATLTVDALGDDYCGLQITGSFSTLPVANSVVLTIEAQNETRDITFINYSQGETIHWQWSPEISDGGTADAHVLSNVGRGNGQMHCGEPLTFSLTYRDALDNRYYTSQAVDITPNFPQQVSTYINLTNQNNERCSVSLNAAVPTMYDNGSLGIMFGQTLDSDAVAFYSLRDYQPGELISFDLSTSNWAFGSNRNVVASQVINGYAPECNKKLSARLYWTFMGIYQAADSQSVTPTFAISWPTVSVTPIGGPKCSVAVTVRIPQAGDQANTLYVGDPNGAYVQLDLVDFGSDPFTIIVPLTDSASTRSDYVHGTPTPFGTYQCGSVVGASVLTVNAGEAPYSSYPIINMPNSYADCGFGTFHQNGGCVPAPIGSFVNSLNANSATSCPRDFTTAQIGSTSVNDCYKPIIQIVKGLKAPKALKFKVTLKLPVITNTGVSSRVTASGSCTAVTVPAGTKVAGKKVTVATAVVKTGTTAGVCTLTFESGGAMPYTALNQTLTIKVNKKGK